MTGWAVLGLEAAGVQPARRRHGGATPITYLRRRSGEISDHRRHRADDPAARRRRPHPRRFQGHDLVSRLLAAPRRRRLLGRAGQPHRVRDPRAARRPGRPRAILARQSVAARRPERRRRLGLRGQGRERRRTAPGRSCRRWPPSARGAGDAARGLATCAAHSAPGGGFALSRRPGQRPVDGLGGAGPGRGGRFAGVGAQRRLAARLSRLGARRATATTATRPSSDQTPVWVTGQALMAVRRRGLPAQPGGPGRSSTRRQVAAPAGGSGRRCRRGRRQPRRQRRSRPARRRREHRRDSRPAEQARAAFRAAPASSSRLE